MIIEQITAEDVKYFTNETTLATIENAGGMSDYLAMFLTHAKNSEKILPQLKSVRINGEQIAMSMGFDEQEEVMIQKINEIHVKRIKKTFADKTKFYDEAELVFVYNAYSEFDHTYFLTSNGKALNGLECENIELFINEDTIPYLPLTAKTEAKCDNLSFGLYNEDTGNQVFSYPELAVFLKNSETPLVTVNFWEDEVLDSPDPDENSYLLNTEALANDLAKKISVSINTALNNQIDQILSNRT